MKPGIYDMTNTEYHADPVFQATGVPSLSCSGMKRLMPEWGGCPEKFKYYMENPEPSKEAFDFGTIAHEIILGKGAGITIGEFENWKTKESQKFREAARAEGKTPMLYADFRKIQVMAAKVWLDAGSKMLLDKDVGESEKVVVWFDEQYGIWCRAMIDKVIGNYLVDYKTAQSAEPTAFTRSAWKYGYYMQAAHYLEGAMATGLVDGKGAFFFVAQEKEPPYTITPFQATPSAIGGGQMQVDAAKRVFARCIKTGNWPGYTNGKLAYLDVPDWAANTFGKEM